MNARAFRVLWDFIIRMYAEPFAPHHLPHFHAYYQESVAVYGLDPVELISGSLPIRQQRLVEAWTEMHREELLADWQLLQQGRRPAPIAPLQSPLYEAHSLQSEVVCHCPALHLEGWL